MGGVSSIEVIFGKDGGRGEKTPKAPEKAGGRGRDELPGGGTPGI